MILSFARRYEYPLNPRLSQEIETKILQKTGNETGETGEQCPAKISSLNTALTDGCRAPCYKLGFFFFFSKNVRIMEFSYNIKYIKCLNF